jgi:hypothetical protein
VVPPTSMARAEDFSSERLESEFDEDDYDQEIDRETVFQMFLLQQFADMKA